MQYTTLGSTGMTVSEICLGCMGFGYDSSSKYDWPVMGEEDSEKIIERAIDLGINFFDTANTYSWGDSERVLGSALSDYDRDRYIVGTKVRLPPSDDPHPNATGLSRKTIEQELNNSLSRLEMDRVDLYSIHRWDYDTPINQTLRALDDAVQRGKVHHIGASSMWAYQFATALRTSELNDLEQIMTMQNQYNLVYREEEREMLPLCQQENIGVTPWSPVASGFLTQPHEEVQESDRSKKHSYDTNRGKEINERVEELAEEEDVSMAQISLAWLLHKDWVDAPIVGIGSVEHLEEAVEATEIKLDKSDIMYLEEPYKPVEVQRHIPLRYQDTEDR